MTGSDYNLRYDANGIGTDLVVKSWISHSPQATDVTFDLQAGQAHRVVSLSGRRRRRVSDGVSRTAYGCLDDFRMVR